jgi:tetratricopeptide (TPR) repeat protein
MAQGLANLGVYYSELGRPHDALKATRRSVDVLERLANQQPDVFESRLAQSLHLLAASYSQLGKLEKALETEVRLSALSERLAKQKPDAFEPALAQSLINLGICYSTLGGLAEALAAAERANQIFDRLAKQNPAVYKPWVAQSLGALGQICLKENPRQTASYFRQGIETLRRLFLDHPNVFAGLMAVNQQGYLDACKSSGQVPDHALLGPITKALRKLSRSHQMAHGARLLTTHESTNEQRAAA